MPPSAAWNSASGMLYDSHRQRTTVLESRPPLHHTDVAHLDAIVSSYYRITTSFTTLILTGPIANRARLISTAVPPMTVSL